MYNHVVPFIRSFSSSFHILFLILDSMLHVVPFICSFSHILFLILDSSICQAVSQYVRNKQVTQSHDSHMTTVNIHLLEDHQDVPLEILQSNDPIVIIRYCI